MCLTRSLASCQIQRSSNRFAGTADIRLQGANRTRWHSGTLALWHSGTLALCHLVYDPPMPRPSVLVTRRLPSAAVTALQEHFDVDMHTGESGLDPASLQQRLAGKHALVVLLGDRIDRAAIEAGTSLQIIANVAVGYDNLDVAFARSRNIVVTNTPDVLTDAVADFTWALILSVTRRLGEGERLVRRGEWRGWAFDFMLGSSL